MVSKVRLLAVIILVVLASSLFSDGMKVKKTLQLSQVVKKAKVIFIAQVSGVEHKYRNRKAYGRNHRYISQYRVRVKTLQVLKGRGKIRKLINKEILLFRWNRQMPGKWVLFKEHYYETYFLGKPKMGDKIIIYADRVNIETCSFQYVDKIKLLSKVKMLIKQGESK